MPENCSDCQWLHVALPMPMVPYYTCKCELCDKLLTKDEDKPDWCPLTED